MKKVQTNSHRNTLAREFENRILHTESEGKRKRKTDQSNDNAKVMAFYCRNTTTQDRSKNGFGLDSNQGSPECNTGAEKPTKLPNLVFSHQHFHSLEFHITKQGHKQFRATVDRDDDRDDDSRPMKTTLLIQTQSLRIWTPMSDSSPVDAPGTKKRRGQGNVTRSSLTTFRCQLITAQRHDGRLVRRLVIVRPCHCHVLRQLAHYNDRGKNTGDGNFVMEIS